MFGPVFAQTVFVVPVGWGVRHVGGAVRLVGLPVCFLAGGGAVLCRVTTSASLEGCCAVADGAA